MGSLAFPPSTARPPSTGRFNSIVLPGWPPKPPTPVLKTWGTEVCSVEWCHGTTLLTGRGPAVHAGVTPYFPFGAGLARSRGAHGVLWPDSPFSLPTAVPTASITQVLLENSCLGQKPKQWVRVTSCTSGCNPHPLLKDRSWLGEYSNFYLLKFTCYPFNVKKRREKRVQV